MSQQLLALKYPDRAESLDDFQRYRVFLDHWAPLITELETMRRALFARRESTTLGIYAPQGSGKTLFARQLSSDIEKFRQNPIKDEENLWCRIAEERYGDASPQTAAVNHLRVLVRDAGQDAEWSSELQSYLSQKDNRAIVFLDEADQSYFQYRLLGMDMHTYIQSADPQKLLTTASEKFVKQCRTDLRGALFVMLSNKREFLENFATVVNSQHEGMMRVTELPAANAITKEKVVRININRLNYFSYWYCINNASPERKSAIYDALDGAGTFPAAFKAVDAAVSTVDQTRSGRPAIKNSLTLCVLHEDPSTDELRIALGSESSIEFEDGDCKIFVWTENWASKAMDASSRQSAQMLESEWNLRVLLIGARLTAALLDDKTPSADLKTAFTKLFEAPSPYAAKATIEALTQKRKAAISQACAHTPQVPPEFWSSGQARSGQYEPALKKLFPSYNTGSTPVAGFRPDLMVNTYVEGSVLTAKSNDSDKITQAIRRNANFVEVTATRKISKQSVVNYLAEKLKNYIKLMEAV